MNLFNDWRVVILLCLTLGLAPYIPEPHLWGKINWVAGGAVGMALLDWLDLAFHSLPFLLLIRLITINISKKSNK